MSNVLQYDETTGEVLGYLKSADTSLYSGRTDVLINPDVNALDANPVAWRVDVATKRVRDATPLERAAAAEKIKQDERDRIDSDSIPPEILAIVNVMETLKPGAKPAVKAEYKRILGL